VRWRIVRPCASGWRRASEVPEIEQALAAARAVARIADRASRARGGSAVR